MFWTLWRSRPLPFDPFSNGFAICSITEANTFVHLSPFNAGLPIRSVAIRDA
jgi:hypothetical protein